MAADNDQWTEGNPGVTHSQAAGREINARTVVPVFGDTSDKPTDFNDLHQMEGLDAVKSIILDIVIPTTASSELVLTNIPAPLKQSIQSLFWEPNECNGSGKPLATISNLKKLCDHVGLIVRYNVIKKDIELIVPDAAYSVDNSINASLAWIISAANEVRMTTGNLHGYLTHIADENQYNPMVQWIDSKPWDGRDRLQPLIDSVGAKDKTLTAMLIRRWMISGIEAWYSPDGVDDSSVLVLQGEQGAGKTSWLKALLSPEMQYLSREGAMLNPADKDSIIGVIQYAIVELGELDATFKKADVAALKAYISKSTDEIRRPYAQGISKYPRRTILTASVNPLHFLHDDKNRRFWTIECSDDINPRHGIDMQQCWAQIKTYHQAGESWKIRQDELRMLNDHNERYKAPDPIEELILANYDINVQPRRMRYSATQVLQDIGYRSLTTKDTRICAQILRKHFGESTGKLNGYAVYDMPEKKDGTGTA